MRSAVLALIIAAMLYATLFYACGRHTARYATRKGRSARIWFVIGSLFCLFFPIPDLILALLPVRGETRKA